jgi:hypothetical protein
MIYHSKKGVFKLYPLQMNVEFPYAGEPRGLLFTSIDAPADATFVGHTFLHRVTKVTRAIKFRVPGHL